MGTALIYLLVVVAVAAAVFGIASAVFGRGEELAPLPPGATPTRLPVGDVGGDDVRALRFQQAVRGYRMAEVDWVLDRLATELDRIGAERDDLRARLAEVDARQRAPTGVVDTHRRHDRARPVLLGRLGARVHRLPRRRVGPAAARRHAPVRAAEPGGLPVGVCRG